MIEFCAQALVDDLDPFDLSASIAERGPNAGPETWQNAKDAAGSLNLDDETIEQLRDWFGEFGAWDDEDRAAWSRDEVEALTLQYIAGDLREGQALAPGNGVAGIDWAEYEELSQSGTISGNLFVHNEQLWVQLG